MGTEVILAHHLALDGLEPLSGGGKNWGGKLVGFVIIAICSVDELAILHLLRGVACNTNRTSKDQLVLPEQLLKLTAGAILHKATSRALISVRSM